MLEPEALFLDVDGTILKSDHSLSERTVHAIKRLSQKKIAVTLATGRSWEALKPIHDALALTGLAICYNGANIVDSLSGQCVFKKIMAEDVSRHVIEIANNQGMEILAYRHGQLLYERIDRGLVDYLKRVNLQGEAVCFSDYKDLSLTKCILISSPENLARIKRTLEERFSSDCLYTTFSDPTYLEILPGGVNKGLALRTVCRHLGISSTATMAIGDAWNDFPLLEAAEYSWLMGGATPDLKKKFPRNRILPTSDDDGAALVLEAVLGDREYPN